MNKHMEHLEKTLKELEDLYPAGSFVTIDERYKELQPIKNFIITSHINYLKGEIERLYGEYIPLKSQLSKAEQLLVND